MESIGAILFPLTVLALLFSFCVGVRDGDHLQLNNISSKTKKSSSNSISKASNTALYVKSGGKKNKKVTFVEDAVPHGEATPLPPLPLSLPTTFEQPLQTTSTEFMNINGPVPHFSGQPLTMFGMPSQLQHQSTAAGPYAVLPSDDMLRDGQNAIFSGGESSHGQMPLPQSFSSISSTFDRPWQTPSADMNMYGQVPHFSGQPSTMLGMPSQLQHQSTPAGPSNADAVLPSGYGAVPLGQVPLPQSFSSLSSKYNQSTREFACKFERLQTHFLNTYGPVPQFTGQPSILLGMPLHLQQPSEAWHHVNTFVPNRNVSSQPLLPPTAVRSNGRQNVLKISEPNQLLVSNMPAGPPADEIPFEQNATLSLPFWHDGNAFDTEWTI